MCRDSGQTVFMTTHDVEEAIHLADSIFPMTNGGGAVLAKIVEKSATERSHPLRVAPPSAV
jgi:ABC-type nitrate/sulfonate/bicarbonate transport system ATPase subunit